MTAVTLALGITNASLVLGFGVPLARRLAAGKGRRGLAAWLAALGGIYLAECAAFSASMGTNVLGFALAAVWGLVFRRKLAALPSGQRLRTALGVSLSTCLPAISFASVLPLVVAGGWNLLAAEAGYKFGVPRFVPWPFCTIAGFFAAVIGSALVVKTVITTALASSRSPQRATA
ncbi:MAG: hypothetical protein MUP47_10610 [Phycisphaerae bacterium]|nr:hypothetical protein [Phycisphaerae bacterium]